MKPLLLLPLLLSTSACMQSTQTGFVTTLPEAAAAASLPEVPATNPATEDQRLMTFLDAAFEEQLARSPQGLTGLGRKEQYDRLNNYTDAYRQEGLALARRQLAALRAQFDPARLSPAGRLSYRLFAEEIEQDIADFQWRWHSFPASTNGSPAGSLPVFLINQHRVTSVADAEAYISVLREIERVMSEITANMRQQASMGIVPSRFNFAPVWADA